MHKLYHVRYVFDLGDINKCLNSSYLFKEGPPPLRFQSFHTFEELYDAVSSSSFSCCSTGDSLLTASGVESYGYDGTHNWSRDYGAAPQAVINARETLVFISGTVEVLNAPHE